MTLNNSTPQDRAANRAEEGAQSRIDRYVPRMLETAHTVAFLTMKLQGERQTRTSKQINAVIDLLQALETHEEMKPNVKAAA